jgi:hypothetical protein
VVFICECGKKYRAPEGTPPTGHICARCNRPLRPAGTPAPGTDVKVLTEQKKALRDELRTRDRQLRMAQAEILRLRAENQQLREELRRVQPSTPFISIAEAPETGGWRPLELPSDRVELPPVALEEIQDLAD